MNKTTCVVGLQWGDEAKGKIVDILAEHHDIIVRYNGGSNAGHTVVHGGQKFKLSLIPTGIIRPNKLAVMAGGIVINPASFFEEWEKLQAAGVHTDGRLFLSDRAHVIFPYHIKEEAAHEKLSGRPIGTTGRGIGPCYQDKVGRAYAVRVGELLDAKHLRQRLDKIVPVKNRILNALDPDGEPFDAEQLTVAYAAYGQKLKPLVKDTTTWLQSQSQAGRSILFEAAQGSLLDVDHGTYPYVTSSNSSATGIWAGSGLSARRLDRVVGVIKAYTTRVGEGPMPTELFDQVGEQIRQTGKEYGTVTGRPRRCGWFDAVAVRYSAALAGADELALMLLDVLSDFDQLAICVAYECDGQRLESFPSDTAQLVRCKPVYEWLSGWKQDISTLTSRSHLPAAATRYLQRIEQLIGIPVKIVSVGPDREQTMLIES